MFQRKLLTAPLTRPRSTRNTPSRVNPVSSAVCGSTVRMYQKQVTSSARSVCAIISRHRRTVAGDHKVVHVGHRAFAARLRCPVPRRDQMLQDTVAHPVRSPQIEAVVEHRRCRRRNPRRSGTASIQCPAQRDPNRSSRRRTAARRSACRHRVSNTGCGPRRRRACIMNEYALIARSAAHEGSRSTS